MKIENLFESVGPDFSEIKAVLEPALFDQFLELVTAYSKGFKFIREEPAAEDRYKNFMYDNGMLALQIMAGPSKNTTNLVFMISVIIHPRFTIAAKNTDIQDPAGRTLVNFHEFLHTASDFDTVIARAQHVHEIIDKFGDWYFDMSGKYGKIKMLKTTNNLIDGYSRNGDNRFIAIAGDFICEKDAEKDETITRVF